MTNENEQFNHTYFYMDGWGGEGERGGGRRGNSRIFHETIIGISLWPKKTDKNCRVCIWVDFQMVSFRSLNCSTIFWWVLSIYVNTGGDHVYSYAHQHSYFTTYIQIQTHSIDWLSISMHETLILREPAYQRQCTRDFGTLSSSLRTATPPHHRIVHHIFTHIRTIVSVVACERSACIYSFTLASFSQFAMRARAFHTQRFVDGARHPLFNIRVKSNESTCHATSKAIEIYVRTKWIAPKTYGNEMRIYG